MKKYMPALKECILFEGMSDKQIETVLSDLKPVFKTYKKRAFALLAGESVKYLGVILSGRVQVLKEDADGNRAIVGEFIESDIFAEALACARVPSSPVSVQAVSEAEIMYIDTDKIINAAAKERAMIKNLLMILADKNIFLTSKLEHVSKKNIREKLLSYLHEQMIISGAEKFEVPLGRSDLADFLFIDRSAMTRELSNMKKGGLIEFNGNVFTIKKI
ncbi:cAMP-binding domain of CRP or a regulatory subunit of cAMP-dependent protein kinase [Parelusimicrobium proximum]|uniref:Crp/Fnr family transcriptional regulator n=1 Tax=Parelusimicrobium proximum TaxID=3228953 RepID=UPI003D185A8C